MELIIVASILVSLGVVIAVLMAVFKTVAPIFPYAYTNARLRAMRRELLRREHYYELLKKPYNEILYDLAKKNYPDLTKSVGPDLTYAAVETEFRTNLIATLQKVKRITPQSSQAYIKAILDKYDFQVVESFVRTINAKQKHKKDIYHKTGLFSEDFLTKENPTIDDLYNQLKGTNYEPFLKKHLDALKKGKYKAFEEDMDHYYFTRLLAKASSTEARSYTKYLIDHHNISLALKGMSANIKGGLIPMKELQDKSAEQIAKILPRYNYKVTSSVPEFIERDLRRQMREKGKNFFKKNPLSEASIIGFIILKTIDFRILNILLKMKYHDMSPEKIEEVNLF